MNFPNDIPEEDKYLAQSKVTRVVCDHRYSDLYYGSGISKKDPNIALVAFFCTKCLKIVVKSYDQSMYKLQTDEED